MASYDYRLTALGMCGHIVEMWPLIRRLGVPMEYWVICDICTRIKYKLPSEEIAVWVRIDKAEEKKQKAVKKAVKKAAAPRVKKIKCSLCQQSGHLFTECPMISEPLI